MKMNLDQYKIASKEQALRYDSKGNLLVFKPTAGEHKTVDLLLNTNLPDINYNSSIFTVLKHLGFQKNIA